MANELNPKLDQNPPSNTEKDADDSTTGDEQMTGAQASYLKTLSEDSGPQRRIRTETDQSRGV
ncbi:MAG: DUF3072 domain-containing protein [Chitinophagales bacterium]|nr:DUF3072 domain-containing protein [Hyphomicrobiales bacterium]